MRYWLLSLIFAVCGCDGAQHGQFAVKGSASRSVADVPGSFTVVSGDPQPLTPQSTGRQALLYILALAPSVTSSGLESSSEDGTYVSTYKESWDTAHGKVTADLSWDRRTDKVSAGGAIFDRQQGNAFVLIAGPSGTVAVTQVDPLSAGLDEFVALPQIQAALPTRPRRT